MRTIQTKPLISSLETDFAVYDLGRHVLEVSHEGGLLLAEHVSREMPLKEAVQLDQDETYHLFLVLQMSFTESPWSDSESPAHLLTNERP